MGSYRAVEIGHAVANDPALMERLYARIDSLGLTGDHQRLAGSWSYAQVFADPVQARAAAGMALLLGYGEGERKLTTQEAQLAREAGFGILAEAFGAPRGAGVDPARNRDLVEGAPATGDVRRAVDGAHLYDPRDQTGGLRQEVEGHRHLIDEWYDPTAVDRAHARQRAESEAFGGNAAGELHGQKRAHFEALLHQQATLPRSYPRIAAEEVGGVLTKLVQSGALARTGLGASVERFAQSLIETGSERKALEAAGSGWREARETLIETRLAQVKGYGLTDQQLAFFRAATESWLPVGVDTALGTDAAQARADARAALVAADGGAGADIAELLMRSAIAQDDTYLRMIGSYNRAGTGATPVSPPLSQRRVLGGRAGALLDLIALPESGGNYNAWYGNATQDGVDLATLTVDQVRALQADLVRSQGGSAIGRYQLLDETLDGLVERLGVAGSEPFTPALQDRLALQLARDAGMDSWLEGGLSDTRFAQNLAQVWAGLPADASNQSHYAGIQGNRATLAWDSVLVSLAAIRRGS